MRIQEIRLSAFGKFRDMNLIFPSNFQLIVGRNEAGKTTIVDAVSGILFGFKRGQKSLRERYRPWTGTKYSASLVLAAEDGTRYLIGRDFNHDRLEIFRGRGVRLEPLAEHSTEQILQEGLGLDTPQLFESTLLIRQPEVSMVVKDRMALSKLAEGLGRKISGGDENVPANQALQMLRDKLAELNKKEGSGSRAELAGEVAALELTLAKIDQGYQRYTALIEERERLRAGVSTLEAELNDLTNRVETAKLNLSRAQARAKTAAELERVRGLLAAAKPAAEDQAAVGNDVPAPGAAIALDPEVLARAETLANQLATLEIEMRYGDEEMRKYQAEIDLLEREIAATRAKLNNLDESILDPEVQNHLAYLFAIINENSGRLGELFPRLDKLSDRLRVLKKLRTAAFILCFLTAAAAIVAPAFLDRMESLGVLGSAVFLLILTTCLVCWSSGLRGQARRINEEIEQREEELKTRQAEAEEILKGKTISQYQAEMEAGRLYRNDLWHLEQALAQKRSNAPPAVTDAEAALAEVRRELSAVLAAAGCQDLAQLREAVMRRMQAAAENEAADAAPRENEEMAADAGLSYEALAARERELRAQLDEMAVFPEETTEDLTALIEERENLVARINEARLNLAELGAEIRNYQEFVLVRDRFEVEESLAEARARLANAETIERGLALAAKRLEEAIFEARAHLGPELQEETGRILGEITDGRYKEVLIDLTPGSLEIRLRSPETGAMIDPALLSMGTVDQLYFALRVALARHLTQGRRFPLILDDPFTGFDRGRLAATVRMLAHLSRTNQVIWFTHGDDLARLVRDETGLEPSVTVLAERDAEPASRIEAAAAAEPVFTANEERGHEKTPDTDGGA